MKVLVVGSGGREHAIIWKIAQSKKVSKIYCAPGNGGIKSLAECVDIKATDIEALADFAQNAQIDFTIVGMDDPLMLGIVDKFQERGLKIFGPTQKAALIEGSKAFSKDLMKKYNIPTAAYEVFDDSKAAIEYLKTQSFPIVVKADGLALGKGVLICNSFEEAKDAVFAIMEDKQFGEAGNKVVIEEFMEGQEVSILSFCDGNTIIPMVSAQDHKRALDNDQGLNTGGMGTFSPSRVYTKEINDYCMENIFKPTLDAMREEGRPFTGILFFGLMLTKDGVKVLEYNARFGDPEAQVVLPRLKGDLLEILEACVDQRLHEVKVEWEDNAAVCVVLASGGYPLSYEKGYPITGLEAFNDVEDIIIFHAGTAKKGDQIVTDGGRVLGVTGIAATLDEAIKTAYQGVEKIHFEKKHYRKDIGVK
ncbi:phosphoribosylamine--glycine ligase [Defluviitalea saccharophila]|uniref:Phosphoribosylamine--glycine ligase n=1 Tax=Defluviitalea saccharophila TaxID=879970 RepID=A0ABZ2Y459_9FIRM|nr:phosphoribosylamine--glycine ligase [Candidatus Epulonipiscium sp.]